MVQAWAPAAPAVPAGPAAAARAGSRHASASSARAAPSAAAAVRRRTAAAAEQRAPAAPPPGPAEPPLVQLLLRGGRPPAQRSAQTPEWQGGRGGGRLGWGSRPRALNIIIEGLAKRKAEAEPTAALGTQQASTPPCPLLAWFLLRCSSSCSPRMTCAACCISSTLVGRSMRPKLTMAPAVASAAQPGPSAGGAGGPPLAAAWPAAAAPAPPPCRSADATARAARKASSCCCGDCSSCLLGCSCC